MVRITDESIQPHEIRHAEQVRKLGSECTLLLKSSGLLPLDGVKEVALFGNGARHTIKGGTGSGDVNVRHFVNVEEGLEKSGITITSKKWLDDYDRVFDSSKAVFDARMLEEAEASGMPVMIYLMGKTMPEPEYEFSLDYEGNTAIYVLSRNSGEGTDRKVVEGDVKLTETEIRDITALNCRYRNFLLVLNVGGLIDLTPVETVQNVLLLGQLGQETGNILADLILGKAYPSGKLTTTWAAIEDYPSTKGFGAFDDTEYSEGIYVGYRYFDSACKNPIYPFGYGLSFTEFDVEPTDAAINGDRISISVRVTNTGRHPGKEVVQIYVSEPAGRLDKPYQELVAYAKSGEIGPGQTELVNIEFGAKDMASYCTETAEYILEKGRYIIRAGNSSRNTEIAAVITVSEDITVSKHKNICNGLGLSDMSFTAEYTDDLSGVKELTLSPDAIRCTVYDYEQEPSEIVSEGPMPTWDQVKENPALLDNFVAGLSNEELSYLCLGQFDEGGDNGGIVGSAANKVAGAAGETTAKLSKYGVPTVVMADGPAGIRVCTQYKIVGGRVVGMESSMPGIDGFDRDIALSDEEKKAPTHYAYCTAIPIGTELAQSFSDEVCRKCGEIVGEEMEMFGIQLWLAPALNIHRSPLCGRNFEYYSEDPLVSGRIAAAITKGVQSHKGCGTTIKHFACNNQETNRMRSNSVLSERALREIYLKGFEIAVKESDPAAVMTSYNLINGEHSCNSRDLVTCTLRNEWGFKGIVMTDWFVTSATISGDADFKHPEASAAGCIYAGNDITMPAMASDKEDMLASVGNSSARYPITRAHLQATGKRVLEMILGLGE